MKHSLSVILLIAVIFILIVPLVVQYYGSELAFTPDNLIRINLLAE